VGLSDEATIPADDGNQCAIDRNWVIRGEGNTACLTDEGRKLITKGFN